MNSKSQMAFRHQVFVEGTNVDSNTSILQPRYGSRKSATCTYIPELTQNTLIKTKYENKHGGTSRAYLLFVVHNQMNPFDVHALISRYAFPSFGEPLEVMYAGGMLGAGKRAATSSLVAGRAFQ